MEAAVNGCIVGLLHRYRLEPLKRYKQPRGTGDWIGGLLESWIVGRARLERLGKAGWPRRLERRCQERLRGGCDFRAPRASTSRNACKKPPGSSLVRSRTVARDSKYASLSVRGLGRE